LSRSTYYYAPHQEVDELTLTLMRLIDEEYTRHPFLGSRRMREYLKSQGYKVNRKRVQHLYRKMGIAGVCPKRNLSKVNKEHRIYPYLLRGLTITHNNHVWSTDITYLPMKKGFVYLMAIIDWYSRYVLEWALSTTLEADFCIEALERTLARETVFCDIFNTDQGSQFTSEGFTQPLLKQGIQISMDGRGRALDNIFVERLWRSVKHKYIYLREFVSVSPVKEALVEYFDYYNHQRFDQSLDYPPPAEIYLP
jgi:putative transposase